MVSKLLWYFLLPMPMIFYFLDSIIMLIWTSQITNVFCILNTLFLKPTSHFYQDHNFSHNYKRSIRKIYFLLYIILKLLLSQNPFLDRFSCDLYHGSSYSVLLCSEIENLQVRQVLIKSYFKSNYFIKKLSSFLQKYVTIDMEVIRFEYLNTELLSLDGETMLK